MATFNASLYQGSNAPAQGAQPVVNDTPFGFQARALYVGVGGNIAVTMADGSTAVFSNVPGGSVLPIRCTLVAASGTTATNLIALY
ncbi:hypothetical protein ZHS_8 [Edwardsiella phage vB_EpM_ZHS]|jgi:hypothetical protein|nr:hypothetical protein ZHS_8 [Edwardsiella phage vB_EpM_ZHS]